MAKLYDLDTGAIYSDLNKYATVFCEAAQDKATEMIMKMALEEMDSYYGEYTPWLYDRTGQMHDSSYPEYKEVVGNEYRGGIFINPDKTHHEPNGLGGEADIYHAVWELGYLGSESLPHGNRPIGAGINRLERLREKAYSGRTKKEVANYATKVARGAGYKLLKF